MEQSWVNIDVFLSIMMIMRNRDFCTVFILVENPAIIPLFLNNSLGRVRGISMLWLDKSF